MVLDNLCLQCPLVLSNTCGKGNIKLGSKQTSYQGTKAKEYILESVLLQVFFKSQYFFFSLYLFWAVMGLHYCDQAFSSSGERELLFILFGLLIVVASLAVEHGLYGAGFSSYGTWAQ